MQWSFPAGSAPALSCSSTCAACVSALRLTFWIALRQEASLIISINTIEVGLNELPARQAPRAQFAMNAVNGCFQEMEGRLCFDSRGSQERRVRSGRRFCENCDASNVVSSKPPRTLIVASTFSPEHRMSDVVRQCFRNLRRSNTLSCNPARTMLVTTTCPFKSGTHRVQRGRSPLSIVPSLASHQMQKKFRPTCPGLHLLNLSPSSSSNLCGVHKSSSAFVLSLRRCASEAATPQAAA